MAQASNMKEMAAPNASPVSALETDKLPELGTSTPNLNVPPDKNGLKNSLSKSSSPGWKTMPYILGNEMCERIASFGLTWSMVLYITEQYHMRKETASYTLTITMGITGFAPLFGGFIADAYLGRFRTIVFASVANLLGMVSLLLTATVPTLTPVPCETAPNGARVCPSASKGQLAFLFTAFIFLAVGTGGIRPCSYAFGADQFGETTIEGKKQLQSFFNWYYAALNVSLLLAVTVLTYIQLDVSWAWGFGVSAALMTMSIVVFLCGASKYRYIAPKGSPFAALARVIVAAYRNRKLALPADATLLYHGHDQIDCNVSNGRLARTDKFRWLDRAAVMTGDAEVRELEKRWRLSSVQEVEEVKVVARVAPIWASGILPAALLITQGIFLPLQAQTMDRHLFAPSSPRFQLPASSLPVFSFLALILFLPLYDRLLVPLARRLRLSPDPARGLSLLQRIALGVLLLPLVPLLNGLVESHRRRPSSSPLPVLALSPPLILLGVAEAFNAIGQIDFFLDQMPPSLRSVAGSLFSCSFALGGFLSSILVGMVQAVTGTRGHRKWIAENLDDGHLDYFYYFLAGLLGLNCIYFWACARNYTYNEPAREYSNSACDSPKGLAKPPV